MSSPTEADIVSARDNIASLAQSLGAQRNGDSGRPVKVRCAVAYTGARFFHSLTPIHVPIQTEYLRKSVTESASNHTGVQRRVTPYQLHEFQEDERGQQCT